MSDFQKSVDRDDPKFEWVDINPMEKNKSDKENLYSSGESENEKSKSFLAALVIVWFKKFLNIFRSDENTRRCNRQTATS